MISSGMGEVRGVPLGRVCARLVSFADNPGRSHIRPSERY